MVNELYENTYNKKNHFSFGRNWQNFLKTLNNEQIEKAKKSLIDFLGGADKIKGKTFVDIGCGSGLFSMAAIQLGASDIVSIDIDDFSIACTNYLKEKEKNPLNWRVIKGSAMDENFIKSLGQFDIVYSWGVLHHSGNMYKAFENIINLLKSNSVLYLAIYNENKNVFLEGTSNFWLNTKKVYNESGILIKKIILYLYMTYYILGLIFARKNPLSYIKNYKSVRGMNWYYDILDWVGGYPYEYATPDQIAAFFAKFKYSCKKISRARSIGCNEFLISKN